MNSSGQAANGDSGGRGQDDSSASAQVLADYDLARPITSTQGLRSGLTSYGDAHFSLFLRKVFIKALGYSDDARKFTLIDIELPYGQTDFELAKSFRGKRLPYQPLLCLKEPSVMHLLTITFNQYLVP